ncbi:hypothetical protein B0H11DRAFT_2236176 [Mycena galericulata]|nr:hypothetical protein B0H11DRAFT_2236176 [Mycena galericulata]
MSQDLAPAHASCSASTSPYLCALSASAPVLINAKPKLATRVGGYLLSSARCRPPVPSALHLPRPLTRLRVRDSMQLGGPRSPPDPTDAGASQPRGLRQPGVPPHPTPHAPRPKSVQTRIYGGFRPSPPPRPPIHGPSDSRRFACPSRSPLSPFTRLPPPPASTATGYFN